MLLWLLAVLAGLLAAGLQYGRGVTSPRVAPLAALRAIAVCLVTALLLGAPAGPARVVPPQVALDASESWLRAAPRCDRWNAALDSANRLDRGWTRFGDSLRVERTNEPPLDRASRLRAVADRAAGSGRPAVVITDGELDEADALSALPHGSRVVVLRCQSGPDVAVTAVEVPRTLLAGDTLTARITVASGAAGSPGGRLELRLDDQVLAAEDVPALGAYSERAIALRAIITGAERAAVLRAVVRAAGDLEPRNDTVSLGVDVSRAAAAVFASSAPDYDAREAVAALRGVTSLPTRAYYRVAPGAWRADAALSRVDEATVRAAIGEAPLVVLHGDTSIFGPPRVATRGALLLFAPPTAEDGEWFAAAAPASPLSAALATLPFDSLAPLAVSPALPRGDWQGLVARRGGAPDDRRTVLVGWDAPRRIAVLGASGLWRWRFRGGVRADAYGALFGTLYDWLAAGRTDRRAAVPEAEVVRAGAPVRWRRGAPADSIVNVTVTRRSATGRVYMLTLRFSDGANVAESPPLAPGVYDVRMAGGSAVLAVNASRELLPRRPTVSSSTIGGAASLADAPSSRDVGWLYVLAVVVLCGEWMFRRRVGMR
jgi:hypothetical protein